MRATELEGEAEQSSTKERAHTEGDAPRKNSFESARRGATRRLPLARTAEKRKNEKRAKTKTKRKRREAIERTIGEAMRGTRSRGALLVGERARGVSAETTHAKVTRPEA